MEQFWKFHTNKIKSGQGECTMQLNGAEILIECLKEQGVDTVFGYPGGAILNVYDELYKHSNEIRHILTSHEQGASHAADGYARATGKVGVCFATSGPGATNLVTGIAGVCAETGKDPDSYRSSRIWDHTKEKWFSDQFFKRWEKRNDFR